MPHLTARVPEARLAGHERALITALTDAVVQVYGEWARELVVVHLDGVPQGRRARDTAGARQDRPGGGEVAARLVSGLTDAVASVLGEQARSGTSVELAAAAEGRTGIGGTIPA